MNELTLDDLYKMYKNGKVEDSYSLEITSDMLDKYAELFENISPLHTDDEYAREAGYKRRIVPQLLIVSQLLPMIEMHLPGKYGLGLGASDLVFKNPVYIGDTLCFKGELVKISRAAKLILLGIIVTNQNNDIVIECKWKVKVLK